MNSKRVIFISIVAILLLAGAFLLQKKNNTQDQKKPVVIQDVEPSMTPEAKAFYEKRLADAEKAVSELKPDAQNVDKFNAYRTLADAQFSLGKYNASKASFITALNLLPRDWDTWYVYSTDLAAMKDYDTSLEAVKKAIEINPNNPDFWTWQINLEKDRFNASQDRLNSLYLDALKNTKEDLSVVVAYARFLEEKGDKENAIRYWQKAIEINQAKSKDYQKEIDKFN